MIRFKKINGLGISLLSCTIFRYKAVKYHRKLGFLSDLLQEEANTKSKRNGGKGFVLPLLLLAFSLGEKIQNVIMKL
jgi:hypothetical protein